MTATLPAENCYRAKNYGVEKETIACWVGIASDATAPVIVRCYSGRSRDASRVYASVWIGAGERSYSGTGYTSGYGYHKPSAAVAAALDSAGITLSDAIDGRGDSAIIEAIEAIIVALGLTPARVVRAV